MRAAPVNRLHTFLTRNLWAQVALSVLGASALVLLISPGESPAAVLTRVAFSSLGGVAVLTALTGGPRQTIGFAVLAVAFPTWIYFQGRKQLRRLHRMREALEGERSAAA